VKTIEEMTQAELGAFVQTLLGKQGIEVVLSGGAAVAIYSSNKYVSKDLDMVRTYAAGRRAINAAMAEMGFEEEAGKYFKHPNSEYLVEFAPGPPTVGEEPVGRIDEMEFSTGTLRIISPTDCVKDRLAGYYHWQDRQSLLQAVMVASDNEVDLKEIKRWSNHEGKLDKFEDFRTQLASTNIAQAE
jgi:hypothetical protein